ncbi:MAG: flavin reductase [Thermoplasmatales archaeon]|nr:flavin reductase [Thermoplasmatales archaeon]
MDKKALHKISYGLYIVSSKKGDMLNGQIANSVFQVCSEPQIIAVCINKENLTNEFIEESRVFSISILSKSTPLVFIGKFGFRSGREIKKFENLNYKIGKSGAPIPTDYSVAYIECEIIEKIDIFTHTIFFGKVIDAEIVSDEEPMTYAYYHEIKGKVPKSAPTYIKV